MSSTKDTKAPESESHPPSDLNIDDEPAPAATSSLEVASSAPDSAAKKLGSPQFTKDDPFHKDTVEHDEEDDLEAHSAVPFTTSTTTDTIAATSSTIPTDDDAAAASATVAPVPMATTTAAPTSPPVTHTQAAPTAPAATEREAKLAILTEAFPTVEKEVCEFVLESHRGNVEASINALLEISDPDFQPEPEPQQAAPAPIRTPAAQTHAPVSHAPSAAVLGALTSSVPPALPRRQDHDGQLAQGVAGMNLNQNQPRTELDPIFLASTSTPEQQLRADEDFARTLAAMDEYRARDTQNIRNQQGGQQQQEEEGPGFVAEMKELMDEELPKIKERFNVAADTTKKKVNEWYTQFKASRAESAQRNNATNQGQYSDSYRQQGDDNWSGNNDRSREPIRFGSRLDEDEPLARNRVTPPLSGAGNTTPPLPARPYNVGATDATATVGTSDGTTDPVSTSANTNTNSRRTTLEDELDSAMNAQPSHVA